MEERREEQRRSEEGLPSGQKKGDSEEAGRLAGRRRARGMIVFFFLFGALISISQKEKRICPRPTHGVDPVDVQFGNGLERVVISILFFNLKSQP